MQINPSLLLNEKEGLLHYFSTKKDGNIAFHVEDDEVVVRKNHRLLAEKLSYNYKKLVHMKQIHSSNVHIVTEKDDFENPPTCDALITNKKNIPLMVMVADCSPILLYDPIKKVIAVVHAGRQGAFKNIIGETLKTMGKKFHCKNENILASIGASIGSCCYEVGSEIYDEAQSLDLTYALTKHDKSYFLDVNSILLQQLQETGIQNKNIEISNECSSCLRKKYFSYRAEGQTGRFSGILMMY